MQTFKKGVPREKGGLPFVSFLLKTGKMSEPWEPW
jgi:hypothetical protein